MRVMATVLIVDDHASFRASARALFEAEGYDVVGEAADGAEALDAVDRLRPDVVLLDVQLPDTNGFALALEISKNEGGPRIVLTSSRELADYADLVETTPARGFVPKDELTGETLAELLGP
jgi:DNA-binding NarL/FixJ family response regulator